MEVFIVWVLYYGSVRFILSTLGLGLIYNLSCEFFVLFFFELFVGVFAYFGRLSEDREGGYGVLGGRVVYKIGRRVWFVLYEIILFV